MRDPEKVEQLKARMIEKAEQLEAEIESLASLEAEMKDAVGEAGIIEFPGGLGMVGMIAMDGKPEMISLLKQDGLQDGHEIAAFTAMTIGGPAPITEPFIISMN